MVSARPLRIAFFGTPEFAVPTLQALIDSRHEMVALVSQPDRPRGRGHKLVATPTKAVAEAHGIRVLQPDRIRDEAFLRAIADLELDLAVVAAYGRILPDALLALPRLGMINVHASLLPAYRGAAPVHRAVIDGLDETGVTIMRVVRELDAGPMLAAVRRTLAPDETSVEVERGLASLGAPLLLSVVEQLADGTVVETPQNDALATYAPKIQKSEGAIDWSLPAARIHNLVRGLQPWPLVSGWLEGRRYLIHRTEFADERASTEAGGTVVDAGAGTLMIAGGDGRALRILQIQPEGKRVMDVREFLAGHPVRVGSQFGPA
jgi:methionyl-tRNA formyltransferase